MELTHCQHILVSPSSFRDRMPLRTAIIFSRLTHIAAVTPPRQAIAIPGGPFFRWWRPPVAVPGDEGPAAGAAAGLYACCNSGELDWRSQRTGESGYWPRVSRADWPETLLRLPTPTTGTDLRLWEIRSDWPAEHYWVDARPTGLCFEFRRTISGGHT